jgi:hypothetical protein
VPQRPSHDEDETRWYHLEQEAGRARQEQHPKIHTFCGEIRPELNGKVTKASEGR